MRILVLGGYGLIGLAVSKRLLLEGPAVTGLARSARRGEKLLPDADWLAANMSKLTRPSDWLDYLENVEAVVNAAGVLQNGLNDNVKAVQRDSILALIDACEQQGIDKFVQISAPGVSETASTLFYRSKAAADQALKTSGLEWTIFRPGLVISAHAYGGTSLIRMLAAFPFIQPLVMADKQIQTVSVDDVSEAVAKAVNGGLAYKDIDLVEPTPHSLSGLVLNVRSWLGFAEPKAVLKLPVWFGWLTAKSADFAGWLGWRSALRTTALSVMANDVTGNPDHWREISGRPARTLEQTLGALPSTAQE
ncbi:MAG: NAD(P)H-binding protein, partial [Henriciella sp.]|nr:NAD(P)H-binding protein [Henriciella sp.]